MTTGGPPKLGLPTLLRAKHKWCSFAYFSQPIIVLQYTYFYSCWLFFFCHGERSDPTNRMLIVFTPTVQAWLTADNESRHRDDGQPQHELHIRGLYGWVYQLFCSIITMCTTHQVFPSWFRVNAFTTERTEICYSLALTNKMTKLKSKQQPSIATIYCMAAQLFWAVGNTWANFSLNCDRTTATQWLRLQYKPQTFWHQLTKIFIKPPMKHFFIEHVMHL